jgi:hypothetical protein
MRHPLAHKEQRLLFLAEMLLPAFPGSTHALCGLFIDRDVAG